MSVIVRQTKTFINRLGSERGLWQSKLGRFKIVRKTRFLEYAFQLKDDIKMKIRTY